jgi:hypothetical protein
VTLVLSIGLTATIAYVLKAVIGLRPSADAEEAGLDQADHGESGYHGDEMGRGGLEHLQLPSPSVTSSALLETSPTGS